MLNRIVCLGLLATVCALANPGRADARAGWTLGDDDAESLVRQLSSATDSARLAAKVGLIGLGQTAVGPLMALLEDLRNHVGPRFALGKEKEGAQVWDHYWSLPL